MIYANYTRFGRQVRREFEDDEVAAAVCFLNMPWVFTGSHAIINITDEKDNILMTKDQIWGQA